MKKYLLLIIIPLFAVLVFTHNGQSKTKAYYSGDAISFNDELYITSANSGSLEVLKLENNKLKLINKSKVYNGKYNRYDDFFDSKLSVENNHLFIYATNGFSIYKYEITSDNKLVLITNQQNTYWEWYNRIDKFGDKIVTISANGVKIWNKDLQVIDGYDITNIKTPYNIRSYNDNLILDVQDGHLIIFDRATRTKLKTIALNYRDNVGNRQAYQDNDNNLYVVDDYYAKKYNLDGKLMGSFQHLEQPGYDISGSGMTDFVYFSNGIGVVKLNMYDMSEEAYTFTGGIAGPRGWAMGLKTVYADGDKVVVFNNSTILVLNDKLKKVDSYTATEEDIKYSTENLFLDLDHNSGTQGAAIKINGGGYFPDEKLTMNFNGTKTDAQADNHGRFETTLNIPTISTTTKPGVDIKVDGVESKLTYSISFNMVR